MSFNHIDKMFSLKPSQKHAHFGVNISFRVSLQIMNYSKLGTLSFMME